MYDTSYDMEDFYGDYVTITVYADGSATCTTPDWLGGGNAHHFASEDEAYDWAYRRGYRE